MISDFGRRAESMGLDSIWMGEQVALFDKNTFGYPGSKDGRMRIALGVDDQERAAKALVGLTGKRLRYRDSSVA